MAKKYKFKLDGLLKLRSFKEEKLKVELGQINQEVYKVKERIKELENHIADSYVEQEKVFADSSNGQLARFFPYYMQAKREDIKNQENLLYSLQKKYERKLNEVHRAMGETKIISNMKDKDMDNWRKAKNKEDNENMEESVQMRQFFKEREL